MDCEKFDEHVMDTLYGELDELTAAAVRRHVESCQRCAGILSNLKDAREGATLPLDEPSPDLEDRILTAERAVQKSAPWHRKLLRAAAWAGSHAMRPQLAMAAVFVFVIGSSLLLLRAKPGTFAPVSVSEKGAPASEERAKEAAPAARPPAAAARGRGAEAADMAGPADRDSAAKTEAMAPAATAAPGGATPMASASAATEPQDELAEALALKDKDGCSAAIAKLQAVADGRDEARAEVARRALEACSAKGTAAPGAPGTAPPSKP